MARRSIRGEVTAVALFLGSAVSANLLVSVYGQVALLVTAWVLIPFDLVTRDVLHDRWHGRRLWFRMALLILVGACLTVLAVSDAWRVALASFVAFVVAGFTNTAVYQRLIGKSRYLRMNISNLAAAVADSIAFPVIAFGVQDTSMALCAGQAASKFAGGLLWSALYIRLLAQNQT